MKKFGLIIAALLCVVYLVNPGAGLIEIIPDNLPFVGNLDEVSVTLLLLKILKELGIDILRGRKKNELSK
jgi:uncharacterized membrane protein YkvA (DUF1232 family)